MSHPSGDMAYHDQPRLNPERLKDEVDIEFAAEWLEGLPYVRELHVISNRRKGRIEAISPTQGWIVAWSVLQPHAKLPAFRRVFVVLKRDAITRGPEQCLASECVDPMELRSAKPGEPTWRCFKQWTNDHRRKLKQTTALARKRFKKNTWRTHWG